jgi:hypothetical protein
MSSIKKHKKIIAALEILSFLFLLEFTSLTLPAKTTLKKPQAFVSGESAGPGFMEQESPNGAPLISKRNWLPIVIGVVAAGAVAALLIFVVFKSKYNPKIDPANFVKGVTNLYFPLVPGQTMRYRMATAVGVEDVTITTTNDTIDILGVSCMAVHDVVTVKGATIEDTWDWYAQDKNGDVWYFGEETKKWDNGVMSTEGSWQAGINGAKPGMVMYGDPKAHLNEVYRQEYLKGVAEDRGQVIGVNETVTVPYGTFSNCIKIKDYSDLEPDVIENKYFAPGVGNVLTVMVQGGTDREELISVSPE